MTERPFSAEETLRLLARAIAPYLADELRHLESLEDESLSANYDNKTCQRYVADLGDEVLGRAGVLFRLLANERVVDSLQLAQALGITPRELSGYLTTPLKRRAKALHLSLPFAGGLGTKSYGGIPAPSPDMDPERTHWQDRDGIARRMLGAIDELRESRSLTPEALADKKGTP